MVKISLGVVLALAGPLALAYPLSVHFQERPAVAMYRRDADLSGSGVYNYGSVSQPVAHEDPIPESPPVQSDNASEKPKYADSQPASHVSDNASEKPKYADSQPASNASGDAFQPKIAKTGKSALERSPPAIHNVLDVILVMPGFMS